MNTLEFNYRELTSNELVSINAGSEFSEAVFYVLGSIGAALYAFYLGAKDASYAQCKCM